MASGYDFYDIDSPQHTLKRAFESDKAGRWLEKYDKEELGAFIDFAAEILSIGMNKEIKYFKDELKYAHSEINDLEDDLRDFNEYIDGIEDILKRRP